MNFFYGARDDIYNKCQNSISRDPAFIFRNGRMLGRELTATIPKTQIRYQKTRTRRSLNIHLNHLNLLAREMEAVGGIRKLSYMTVDMTFVAAYVNVPEEDYPIQRHQKAASLGVAKPATIGCKYILWIVNRN